jgi:hypothetical protein
LLPPPRMQKPRSRAGIAPKSIEQRRNIRRNVNAKQAPERSLSGLDRTGAATPSASTAADTLPASPRADATATSRPQQLRDIVYVTGEREWQGFGHGQQQGLVWSTALKLPATQPTTQPRTHQSMITAACWRCWGILCTVHAPAAPWQQHLGRFLPT